MQPAQFFGQLKAGAYYNWRNFKVLPSVCAAQAALESGWGESGLTKQANNLFGMKGSYNGASVTMRTAEYTAGGQLYYINAAFRKYPSWNASVVDYANNLRKSGYYPASAFTTQDYKTQITLIGRVYATSPTYAANVIKMIQTYGLDKWDRDAIAGGTGGNFDASEIVGGGSGESSSQYKTFREDYIKENSATRPKVKLNGIKGLVIHEINTNASAAAFRNTLNSGNSGKKMGYHVIVDATSAIAVVPLNEGVNHANRTGQQLVNGLGNANNNTLSIGIINTNKDTISTDTLKNLTLVCAEIARKYQLPTKNIWPAYLVDGVIEPTAWYYNAINYSAFLAVTESVKVSGENVITNPDYGSSSGGSGGLIPGGEGIIKKLLEEAVYWEGKIKYSMERRNQIYPGGYADCSSYTQYVYKKVTGKDIGSNTWAQIAFGNSIPINSMRAGDLVFWEKTYSAPPPTHVGIVLSGRGPTAKVIQCGTSSGVEIITANQIPNLYAARRVFSDADYEASQSTSHTSKPTLSTKSSYAVQVISPTTAYSADTGGTSLKRLPTGEVYRVAAIGTNSVKVVSNSTSIPGRGGSRSFSLMAESNPSNTTDLWIPIHSTGIKIAELPTPDASIGTIIPKISIPVLDKPSSLGARVYEGGQLKNLPEQKSVAIYAIENRFAKISPQEEQWVSIATAYAETSVELETSISTEVDFGKGQTIETDILARYVPGDNLLNGVLLESGLVGYAHHDLLPIGSVISIYIPTLKEEKKIVIMSNYLSSSDGDTIEIYFNSEREYLDFGERNGIVSLIGKIDISTELADFFNSIKDPDSIKDGGDYFE